MAVRLNPTSYEGNSTTAIRLACASGPAFPTGSDWYILFWRQITDNATARSEFVFDVGGVADAGASSLKLYYKDATFVTNPKHYQFVCIGSENTATSQTFDYTTLYDADSVWRLHLLQYTQSNKTFTGKTIALGAGSVTGDGSVQKLDFAGIASGRTMGIGWRPVDNLRGQRNPIAELAFGAGTVSDAQLIAMAAGAACTAGSVGLTPVIYLPMTSAAQTQVNQGSGGSAYDFVASNSTDIGSTVAHPFASLTMAADTGSFTLAGQAATLGVSNVLVASAGTFALAGQAATLRDYPLITLSEPVDGGNINLASSTVTNNGMSPIITLVPRVQVCSDISATAKWWGFRFNYNSDVAGTTPIVNVRITSPAQWHLATLGDSLTPWRPPYSSDGWATVGRAASQDPGTHSNSADANYRTFQMPALAAGSTQIASDIPHALTGTAGVEQTLAGWLTGPNAAMFQPSATAAALPDPGYTPSASPSTLKPYIAWMTTATTREDGQSVPSLPSYGPILDDPALQPEAGNAKVACEIICLGHPSESSGRKTNISQINRIQQADAVGNTLRKYVSFVLALNPNAAGEYAFNWRASPEDPNRDYNRHFDDSAATVTNRIIAYLTTERGSRRLAGFFDDHSEGNSTPSIYGRQTDPAYVRFKAKLIAKRAATDFSLDADDGKRSWNYAKDVQGAAVAVIVERESIGTPNEPDRQLFGEETMESFKEYLDENLLRAVPQGPIAPGVPVEVRFSTIGSAFTGGLTIAAGNLTPSATNGTFGTVTYNAGGKYFSSMFTATTAGAVTFSTTNTQSWINVAYSGAAGAATITLNADAGSFSLAGQAANLFVQGVLQAEAGVFAIAGQSADLIWPAAEPIVMPAAVGQFSLTGGSVQFPLRVLPNPPTIRTIIMRA